MLYGIKYNVNDKGIKLFNKSMSKYGCGILTKGKCELYFTNAIQAWLTAKELGKYHKDLSYRVFIPSKEDIKNLTADDIVNTSEEYKAKMEIRSAKLIEALEMTDQQFTCNEPEKQN